LEDLFVLLIFHKKIRLSFLIQETFKMWNNLEKEKMMEYGITKSTNFNAIQTNVIPFFNRFGFLSAKKKRDFSKFKKIAKLIENKII
jgi:hypothetical protein